MRKIGIIALLVISALGVLFAMYMLFWVSYRQGEPVLYEPPGPEFFGRLNYFTYLKYHFNSFLLFWISSTVFVSVLVRSITGRKPSFSNYRNSSIIETGYISVRKK